MFARFFLVLQSFSLCFSFWAHFYLLQFLEIGVSCFRSNPDLLSPSATTLQCTEAWASVLFGCRMLFVLHPREIMNRSISEFRSLSVNPSFLVDKLGGGRTVGDIWGIKKETSFGTLRRKKGGPGERDLLDQGSSIHYLCIPPPLFQLSESSDFHRTKG